MVEVKFCQSILRLAPFVINIVGAVANRENGGAVPQLREGHISLAPD